MIADDYEAIAEARQNLERQRAMATIGEDLKSVETCINKFNNGVNFKSFTLPSAPTPLFKAWGVKPDGTVWMRLS